MKVQLILNLNSGPNLQSTDLDYSRQWNFGNGIYYTKETKRERIYGSAELRMRSRFQKYEIEREDSSISEYFKREYVLKNTSLSVN